MRNPCKELQTQKKNAKVTRTLSSSSGKMSMNPKSQVMPMLTKHVLIMTVCRLIFEPWLLVLLSTTPFCSLRLRHTQCFFMIITNMIVFMATITRMGTMIPTIEGTPLSQQLENNRIYMKYLELFKVNLKFYVTKNSDACRVSSWLIIWQRLEAKESQRKTRPISNRIDW